MYTYNQVKSECEKLERLISTAKRNLKALTREQAELKEAQQVYDTNRANALAKEESAAYEEYVKQAIAPIEERIKETKQKIVILEQSFKKKQDAITFDNVRQELLGGEKDITEEIAEELQDLEQQLIETLGESFKERAIRVESIRSTKLSEDEVLAEADKFNRTTSTLKRFNKLFRFSLLDKITSWICRIDTSKIENNAKNLGIAIGIAVALVILLVAFSLPFYSIILFLIFIEGIAQGFFIHNALESQLKVQKNLELFQQKQNETIEEIMQGKKSKLIQNYQKNRKALDDNINKLNYELNNTVQSANQSFVFERDPKAESEYELRMQSTKDRLKTNEHNLAQAEEELNRLKSELELKNVQLVESFGTIKEQYLSTSTVGKEFIYSPKFLLDLTDVEPVFYTHNKSSTLFLYDELNSAVNFARLIMQQIRVKLSPLIYSIYVFDTLYSGREFQAFMDDKVALPFTVCSDKKEVEDCLVMLSKRNTKMVNILKTNKDIDAYNKLMLEIEGVPESYNFVFSFCQDLGLLSHTEMLKMCASGGPVGIYLFNFIDYDIFKASKQQGEIVVERTNQFYTIIGDKFYKKAKNYIKTEVLGSES